MERATDLNLAEIEALSSLPRKRSRGKGRPITNRTKLGRMINNRNIRMYRISSMAGISPRLLTEYVQARRIIPHLHLSALCEILQCNPEEIVEEWLTENLTDACGVPRNGSGSVRDIDHLRQIDPEPERPKAKDDHVSLPPLPSISPTFIKRPV